MSSFFIGDKFASPSCCDLLYLNYNIYLLFCQGVPTFGTDFKNCINCERGLYISFGEARGGDSTIDLTHCQVCVIICYYIPPPTYHTTPPHFCQATTATYKSYYVQYHTKTHLQSLDKLL